MELLDTIAKPIQAVKELFDLDAEIEPPSLASQFVAVKHELNEIQKRLAESDKISREKDKVISELKGPKATDLQKRLVESYKLSREKDELIAKLQQ
ncbi:MAG: hypothetical protein ACYTAS_23190, partial [Planctomycetota bacterium]